MADLEPIARIFLTAWFTFFGACIGSFLNVVVYRLPRGKSLSNPPSFCPKCKHPIRWHDNVPVFGWLLLRGKCRDCSEPISPRYPLVEFVCGAVFGIIAETVSRVAHGMTLTEFFLLTASSSGIIVTLIAAGLIRYDGSPVPLKAFGWCWGVLALVFFWTLLRLH